MLAFVFTLLVVVPLDIFKVTSAFEIVEEYGTRPPRPDYTPGVTRPSRPKANNSTSTVQYHPTCNVTAPSKDAWDGGEKKNVTEWAKKEWDLFFFNQSETFEFPTYMRWKYAADLAPSAFGCQALGSCSIGDCQNIGHDFSDYDRQMAYWVFESIANIDLTAKTIKDAIDDVTQDIHGRSSEMVALFTWRTELHQQKVEEKRQRELDMQIASSILLILTAAIGVGAGLIPILAPAATAMAAWASLGSNIANMVTSTYLGISGLTKQLDVSDTNYINGIQNDFENHWQRISSTAENSIKKELEAYWTGYRGEETWDEAADELIASGAFVEFNTAVSGVVKEITGKWFTAIQYRTSLELYIVDSDTHNCNDDKRGPPRNKICLPEKPGRAFWLYGIGPGGSVASPPGLKAILENPDSFYGITKEDIVRSSVWIHEHHIKREDVKYESGMTPETLEKRLPGLDKAGGLAGAFTIPICRNPRGEAISSVWSKNKEGQNYPCRCGEIPTWRDKSYRSKGVKESQQFYIQSGLYASNDFENYCQHEMECKGDDNMHWVWNLKNGSLPVAGGLKYTWKKCEEKSHSTYGDPSKDK